MFDPRTLPLSVFALAAISILMLVPSLYAYSIGAFEIALTFGSTAGVVLVVLVCVGFAVINRRPSTSARSNLLTLLGCYLSLPIVAAIPLWRLGPDLEFGRAYFEMLSCLSTTGFEPVRDDYDAPVHLWRGLVAWLGGFLTILGAVSILEPLKLGGFEVHTGRVDARSGGSGRRSTGGQNMSPVFRNIGLVGKVYGLASFALILILLMCGEAPFQALMYGLAVISTSGITGSAGLSNATSGILGEIAILLFFGFAISHNVFVTRTRRMSPAGTYDPEIRTALIVILGIAVLLFMFNLAVAIDTKREFMALDLLREFWGLVFTLAAFLTTTGFESVYWSVAQSVSGQEPPLLILLLVAILGGGIATTAGGLKLMRIYVLMSHGKREIERLVHPSSVAGPGSHGRLVRREGAFIAWIFVMLFFLALLLGVLGLSAAGLDFEQAIIVSVAALANVGPLASFQGQEAGLGALSVEPLMIINFLMVVGRMEILAVAALLNPEYWRR